MLFVTSGHTFTIGNADGGIIAFGPPSPPPPQTKWGGLQTIIYFFYFCQIAQGLLSTG